jgi:hypothetical protein
MLDALNKALEDLGLGQFSDRDQVEAVICIVVRKELNGGMLIGRTSARKMMEAILEFLMDNGTISEEFGKAIWATWMMERIARQK